MIIQVRKLVSVTFETKESGNPMQKAATLYHKYFDKGEDLNKNLEFMKDYMTVHIS